MELGERGAWIEPWPRHVLPWGCVAASLAALDRPMPGARIPAPMDIKGAIEWVANHLGSTGATIFPFLLVGLVGLYLLGLIVGYLRVSQVGLRPEGEAVAEPSPLPRAAGGAIAAPSGVPYCPTDGLRFGATARYCPVCEADLLVSCANCGAEVRAADERCYRCGTRQTVAEAPAE